MKEIVISLLEDNEKARVLTSQLVKDALSELVDDKIIEIGTREKCRYTHDESFNMKATYAVKLVDCNAKFRGAFVSWFAYRTAPCTEVEPNEFHFNYIYFDGLLGELNKMACFMHRINGIKENEEYKGKILLKIYDFMPLKGKEGVEIEPLPKHAKYFDEYAEFNPFDF